MKESLATFYRPKTFDEVVGQDITVKILKQQLKTKTFSHNYLFCGPSGDGKTTLARIFANELNNGEGTPIEVDAASNNGVDNVRNIIEDSATRAIDAMYKVIIIDEAHMISIQGWNAFLKTIEEPSAYTIFIFCTTDPQKIPDTIQNRVTRFNLNRISNNLIADRLRYICKNESYTNYDEACDFIAKISNGGMRDAITTLEKCAGFSTDLCITNVIQSLGNFSYEVFINITNALIDKNDVEALRVISEQFDKGADLKIFIEQYLDFILNVNKYILFKDINLTNIPKSLEKTADDEDGIAYLVNFGGSEKFFKLLADKILDLKNALKYDTMPKVTIEINIMQICRGL